MPPTKAGRRPTDIERMATAGLFYAEIVMRETVTNTLSTRRVLLHGALEWARLQGVVEGTEPDRRFTWFSIAPEVQVLRAVVLQPSTLLADGYTAR